MSNKLHITLTSRIPNSAHPLHIAVIALLPAAQFPCQAGLSRTTSHVYRVAPAQCAAAGGLRCGAGELMGESMARAWFRSKDLEQQRGRGGLALPLAANPHPPPVLAPRLKPRLAQCRGAAASRPSAPAAAAYRRLCSIQSSLRLACYPLPIPSLLSRLPAVFLYTKLIFEVLQNIVCIECLAAQAAPTGRSSIEYKLAQMLQWRHEHPGT